MNTENTNVNTDETVVTDVEATNVEETKAPGRPVIPDSKRQLNLKLKNMLKEAGVVSSGRPIDIEKARTQIAELQEKIDQQLLREELEAQFKAELGIED